MAAVIIYSRAVHKLAVNALLQGGLVDNKAHDHTGDQHRAHQGEVGHNGMNLHQQSPDDDTDDHHNAHNGQLEGQGVQRGHVGHAVAHRHPVLRTDIAGALALIHVRKGHLHVGQAPLGAHVDDDHTQNHAAQDADGGEGNAHAHSVVPEASVLDDVAHGGGVAVAGVEAPHAHVAELIGERAAQQSKQGGNSQADHHLALMGYTSHKGGGHAVTAHLIEFQTQEHGGAYYDDQNARPLSDPAGKGDIDRGDLAQPAGAEKHADGSRDQGGRNKEPLENGDPFAQFKSDEKQYAEVCEIRQYISQCHAGSHLSLNKFV